MCTAVVKDNCFGRNLDLEGSFGEKIVLTPRRFPFAFRHIRGQERHYAMLGTAHLSRGYPLYYDAMNEKGLFMAGLNFPGWALYHPCVEGKENLAPFELIPRVLGQCATVGEARELLGQINLIPEDFSPHLPRTPMHWMVADGTGCLAVEPLEDGLQVADDPVGVLTNSPPLKFHLLNLTRYRGMGAGEGGDTLLPGLPLPAVSRGMGSDGLPGGLSSSERFVRGAFTLANAAGGKDEWERIGQIFHILDAVAQTKGCVRLKNGALEHTLYSCCCSPESGRYCYTTYENRAITAVTMEGEELDGGELKSWSMAAKQRISGENGPETGV